MNRVYGVLTAALLFAVLTLLGACARSDPEKELRATLVEMQAAVQKRDPSAFMAHVADDFTRQAGGMDAKELRRTLAAVFIRNQSIDITATVRELAIEPGGKRATVQVTAAAAGGQGALLPERAQGWDIRCAFRRQGNSTSGKWQAFNCDWKELL
jgi:ketosteroid isomerase-like protein